MSRMDPTKTTMLRRRYVGDMKRRFREIRKAVNELVLTLDVFGLKEPQSTFKFDAKKGTFVSVALQNVEKEAWKFRTSKQKVKSFNIWMQDQYDQNIFEGDWTDKYVTSAYRKGIENGYSQVNKRVPGGSTDFYQGGKQQFVQSAFGAPETREKLELLYTRTFEELKGVTAAMSQQMSRVLTTGLANGYGPAQIARELTKTIDTITNTRALALARTEIINVHADAQLDSYQMMDIGEVKLQAEYSTADDALVCEICAPDEGKIMSIAEARGLITQHPNCRCSWNPHIPDEKKKPARRAPVVPRTRRPRVTKPKTVKKKTTKKKTVKKKAPVSPAPAYKPSYDLKQVLVRETNDTVRWETEGSFMRWFNGDTETVRRGEDVLRMGMEKTLKQYPKAAHKKLRVQLADAKIEAQRFNSALDKSASLNVKGGPYRKVYRGGGREDYPAMGKLEKGDIFVTEGGSMSTSTSQKVAKEFAQDSSTPYILEIESHSATSILSIAPEEFAYQKEVILRYNTRYKVTSVKKVTRAGLDDDVLVIGLREIDEVPLEKAVKKTVKKKTVKKTAPVDDSPAETFLKQVETLTIKQNRLDAEELVARKRFRDVRDSPNDATYLHAKRVRTAAVERADEHRDALRDSYAELLRAPNPVGDKLKVSVAADLKDDWDIQQGIKFMQGLIDDSSAAAKTKMPRIKHARTSPHTEYKNRSHFARIANVIYTKEGKGTKAMVHELGHRFDNVTPIKSRLQKLYDTRTKGYKAETMNSAMGHTGFLPTEMTKKDKFLSAYMGRVSGAGHHELGSMGTEYLLMDPVLLAKEEPALFDMLIKFYHGRSLD